MMIAVALDHEVKLLETICRYSLALYRYHRLLLTFIEGGYVREQLADVEQLRQLTANRYSDKHVDI